MVYAKTPFGARELSRQITKNQMKKYYYALICGKPALPKGMLVNNLYYDKKLNITRVLNEKDDILSPDKKQKLQVKEAKLLYKVVPRCQFNGFDDYLKQKEEREREELTLVDIELITGRHHQIRAQFADFGTPLWGDTKYNPEFRNKKGWSNIALCAYKLEFIHPRTKKKVVFRLQ